ncbi:MAG: hypothetical protein ACR2LV_06075 [Solirubrobacteraceae bacterium]
MSSTDEPPSVLGTLLSPLRLPARVISDLETVARAVLSLQETAERHLASIDERVGTLVGSLGHVDRTVEEIDHKIEQLTGLQTAIETRLDAVREDLNKRMLAVQAEVHEMRPALAQMTQDVEKVIRLLPDPSDGPIARLKDTLSSS